MMRVLPGLALLFLTSPVHAEADDPEVPVVKLTVSAATKPAPRSLRYPLLPDPLDLTTGNAALLWLRASHAAAGPAGKMTPKQHDEWIHSDKPLKDLPRADMRKFLETARTALNLADRAARCERCDWDQGPLTFQNFQIFLDPMLADVQGLRALAAILSVQSRLQLSEGDYDGAIRTIQTMLTLGRHLGQGPTMIQSLVGIAITSVGLGQVEQWIAAPGSPNLFWSLTALPQPLVDVRGAVRYELDSLYRSFPALRRLERESLDAKKMQTLLEELLEAVAKLEGPAVTGWEAKVAVGVLAARAYPDAKKYLIDEGEDKAKVEAMPTLQVVVIHMLRQYDRMRDDTMKWLSVPYWQGNEALEAIHRDAREKVKSSPAYLLEWMLAPAVAKVHAASVRTDRYVATLRCLEAVRLYSATHRGKLPEKLGDVKPLPLPLDPVTGEGFDAMYKKDGGKATFEVRSVPGKGTFAPRRYELSEK